MIKLTDNTLITRDNISRISKLHQDNDSRDYYVTITMVDGWATREYFDDEQDYQHWMMIQFNVTILGGKA